MALDEYQRKRDFLRTPEPQGGRRRRGEALRFVVQKHAARRLHYDFRLELDGTLKSWAVPKGPSLRAGERRLAVHVEDHPLEYSDFEGVIPARQHGAGPVLVWDRGQWFPEGEAAQAYRKGHLRFRLEGTKLRGLWDLVRTGGRGAGEDAKNWLLIKVADEAAIGTEVVEEQPQSVLSARTLEEVAAAPDAVWSAGRDAAGTRKRGRRDGAVPELLAPQFATLVDQPPEGAQWLYEIKHDGYRILARIAAGKVRLFSRNGKDWTRRLAAVAKAVARLGVNDTWLDGEVVALLPDGRSSFAALQAALSGERAAHLTYFLFDMPWRDGADWTRRSLRERKAALARLIAERPQPELRYSDHVTARGGNFFREACRMGLEGVVAKRSDGAYVAGRGRDWLKVKCLRRQEFVVGGYTDPGGAPAADVVREQAFPAAKPATVAKPACAATGAGRRTAPPESVEIAGVRLTHADKVLYPEVGLRKRDIAEYYVRVAEHFLPHVLGRPISLVRCPDGWQGPCFFQKHPSGALPEGLATVPITERGGTRKYLMVESLQGVMALVQMGVLEIHPWGSRSDRLEYPDRLIFDLDPDPELDWPQVLVAARRVRDRLGSLGLRSFVQTTGGKGLHVVVPIEPRLEWAQVKAFCKAVAEDVARREPQRYTATLAKTARSGKIFIDYLRNARGATAVASYSTRARAGATVATPLRWEELRPALRSDHYHICNLPARLRAQRADPWAGYRDLRQQLTTEALRALRVAR